MFLVYSNMPVKSISHYYLILRFCFCHIAQFASGFSVFLRNADFICATVFISVKYRFSENCTTMHCQFTPQKIPCLLEKLQLSRTFTTAIFPINTEDFSVCCYTLSHLLFTVLTPAALPGNSEAAYLPLDFLQGFSAVSHMPFFPVSLCQTGYW